MNSSSRIIVALSLIILTSGIAVAQECRQYQTNEIRLFDSFPLNGQYSDRMTVADGRAYVCTSQRLEILDVSDPTQVAVLGTHVLGGFDDVAVSGDLACVTGLSPGIQFFNISDPATLQHVSDLEISNYANYATNDVVAHGDYFYLARDFAGLAVIDASGIGYPDLGITVDVVPLVQQLALDGDLLYTVGDDGSALCVFDLTDPLLPTLLATCPTNFGGNDLVKRGDHVYVASSFRGIQTIDVSDPAAPVLVDVVWGTPAAPNIFLDYVSVEVMGSYLFAVDRETYFGPQTLDVFDLTDPAAPVFAGRRSLDLNLTDLHAVGGMLLGPKDFNGFAVLDVAQPVSTVPLGRESLGGSGQAARVVGDRIFLANGEDGFQIRSLPFFNEISVTPMPDNVLGVTLEDDLAYLAVNTAGLIIVDISNQLAPQQLDDINTPGHARDIGLYTNAAGKLALVADTEYDLVAYDVTDPGYIRPKGVTYFPGQVRDVEVKDGYVLAADDSGLLQVVDVSVFPDPVQPVTSLEVAGQPVSLLLAGDLLFVGGGGYLNAVDVGNPAAPVLLGSVETRGSVIGLVVQDGVAYCATEGWGMDVVAVADPAQLRRLASFDALANPTSVSTDGQQIFLATADGYVLKLPLECLATPAPDELPGAGTAHLGQAYPNPFNPQTTLSYSLPEASRVDLAVYDLAGRLVRRLVAGQPRESGLHLVNWNGQDEAGQAAASGVYLYRLIAGEIQETRRMTLVR